MRAKDLLDVMESLFEPGFDEFSEFVFRDYSKKYNVWIAKGGQKEKQPDLKAVLKANYNKFMGYNKPSFNYTLPEVIDKYRQHRMEELEKKYKDSDKKEKAIEMGLAYFGLNTL